MCGRPQNGGALPFAGSLMRASSFWQHHREVFWHAIACLGLAALVEVSSCSDRADTPVAPGEGRSVQLSVRPQFALSGASRAAPVNRIVITAREVISSQIVGGVDRLVDPNANEWQLAMDVRLTGTAARDVVLAIELLNVGAGVQTVEWSGITIVTLTPGQQRQVTDVLLYAGPLAPVASLTIAPDRATIAVGQALTLSALARDAQNNLLSRVPVWTSSDTTKAVVSSTGVVNGRSAGNAIITARAEGKQATSSIIVYVPIATSLVKLSGDAQTGTVSTALPNALLVGVVDQQGNAVSGQTVQWVVTAGGGSVNPGMATTNASGQSQTRLTLGAAVGAQTAEARAPGVSVPAVVFTATAVAAVPVASVTVTPATRALIAGDTVTLTARAFDAANNALPNVIFSWSSSDSLVARVNALGRVTAGRAGTATIGAAAGGKTGTATVTVARGPAAIISIWAGNGQAALASTPLRDAIVVLVSDAANNPVSNVDVVWSVIAGGGTVSARNARTDANGLASTQWTLGSTLGTQTVEANANGLSGSPVQFTASATGTVGVRKTWVGGDAAGPANWSIVGNWSPAGVPGAADTAVVTAAAANQPRAGGNVVVGTLIVQSGASVDNGGYEISVARNLDVAGTVTGPGSVLMTGSGVTVRGVISILRVAGTVTATGALTTLAELTIGSGNFTVNGQTITVGTDFAAFGGTLTMSNPADMLIVGGSTTFAFNDERGKLTSGTIRAAGDFQNGCYNDTEFVPSGTRVVMNGPASRTQAIRMCSSASGNRFFDLVVASGARVTTGSNPVVIATTLTLNGTLTVESGGVVDVAGPAGSLILTSGGVLSNGGTVRANLPISNSGTVTGNAVVQR